VQGDLAVEGKAPGARLDNGLGFKAQGARQGRVCKARQWFRVQGTVQGARHKVQVKGPLTLLSIFTN